MGVVYFKGVKFMLSWQLRLAVKRRETVIAFSIMLGLAAIGFFFSLKDAFGRGNDLYAILPAYAYLLIHNSIVNPVGNIALMIIPLLASLAFSDSWLCERSSGLSSVLLTRCPAKKYLWSKALACFIIGGLVIAIPAAFNFIWCMIAFPLDAPKSYIGGISSLPMYDYFWKNIYFSNAYTNNPYAYALVAIICTFIYGGISAIVAFAISLMMNKRRVLIISASFLIINIASMAQHMLGVAGFLETGRAPFHAYFQMAEDSVKSPFPLFALVCLALFIGSLIVVAHNGRRCDRL
jgi:hypothetical protein